MNNPATGGNKKPLEGKRYASIADFDKHVADVIKSKCQENGYYLGLVKNLKEAYHLTYQLDRYQNCSAIWNVITSIKPNGRYYYRTVFRNGCGDKFCNICSWQKAKRDKMRIAKVLQECKYNHGKAFIFLTFSRHACSGADLHREVEQLQRAFHQLMQNRQIKTIKRGYVKKLEISYNHNEDTYLPHYHLLLVVDWKDLHKLSRQDWLKLWQKVNPDINISIKNQYARYNVDIRGQKAYKLANYLAKPPIKDYQDIMQDVFNTLHFALDGKWLLVFGGLCKDIKLMLERKELHSMKERE